MRKVARKSAVPAYATVVPWLLGALVLPSYQAWYSVLAMIISAAAYIVMSRVFPAETVLMPEEERPTNAGDAGADTLINGRREQLKRPRALDEEITDPAVSAHTVRICGIRGKIFACLEKNTSKTIELRLFSNYCLPTTVKLLESYERMASQDIFEENIESAMCDVGGILSGIEEVSKKQLDYLFADERLDVSTDITILKSMMTHEGLVKDQFDKDSG